MEILMYAATLPLLFIPISMVLGLVGAPFAALICTIVAHARGLPKSYAGTGAWYSMLFILPWLYLVLRMLDVRIPDGVVRAGYVLFYGLWLYSAAAVTILGLAYIYMLIAGNDDIGIGDIILEISGGLFILCVWFASLRRLLRRNEISELENVKPSMPMRIAYTALHALWLFLALGITLQGMFSPYFSAVYAQMLYILAAIMVTIWVISMTRFRLARADDWDYHVRRPKSGMLPLDFAYIQPFISLYLLIAISICVFVAVFIIGPMILF